MILAIGNIKGGVGKTTLSVNIAIARALTGRDVLLVDGDEQGTSITFTALRTEKIGSPGYTAVSLYGTALRTQVRQLASKYDDIVIDVGGRDTGSLRAALTVSETLLIPVQPRSFDIWAVDQVADLVKEAMEINELRAFAILNAADAQGHDNEEASKVITDMTGIEMLQITIGRRKAFPNAAAIGRSVLEQIPKDVKAVDELTALVNALYFQKTTSV
ncbi:MAG: AAA family ATPase [Myxococcaceae bacterium]